MARVKDLFHDIIEMYFYDGMKEAEIATSLGISLLQVHEAIGLYEQANERLVTDADEVVSYDDLMHDPIEGKYNSEQ
jgi:DNA-binding transcriptional regulator LsrR (DeoR family)